MSTISCHPNVEQSGCSFFNDILVLLFLFSLNISNHPFIFTSFDISWLSTTFQFLLLLGLHDWLLFLDFFSCLLLVATVNHPLSKHYSWISCHNFILLFLSNGRINRKNFLFLGEEMQGKTLSVKLKG